MARGVFSYKYLYFCIHWYVDPKKLRVSMSTDIPFRYSSCLLPLTYCLWEIQLLQFFLIKRPVSRKIYQIELETWNLMQIFLDLCWGKQTSEGDKSESHSTDNISIFFFSKNLNKTCHSIWNLMLIKLHLGIMVWKCLHLKIFPL